MNKRLESCRPTNILLSVLWDDLLVNILEKVEGRNSWRMVCKEFLKIEGLSRKSVKLLRPEILLRTFGTYSNLERLDLSACPGVTNGILWLVCSHRLRAINLSRATGINHRGLEMLVTRCPNLEDIDLSHCCRFGDLEAAAISLAQNLRCLLLVKWLKITDIGLVRIAVGCSKLQCLNLRWCMEITDLSLELVSTMCKDIRSLDISFLSVTNKSLPPLYCLPEKIGGANHGRMRDGGRSWIKMSPKREHNFSQITIRMRNLGHYTILNFSQINISYCRISDGGLFTLFSKLKCLQDVKMVHLTRVSLQGFELALRASHSVKKVKLLDGLKYLLSVDLIHMLQVRGCRIRWLNKRFVLI